ncbi:ComF family protein [Anaeromicropila herbilytica]|uniref:Amidophosphoribosyltransferase n=1 Tax=Anaeromicropila herbilytica TaxID=2785025 RepID=A0A7R7IBH0_9FIRM|nr:ComF family protein [Anaeromicropila herbilytica]BCN29643.1 amidophosphoribosyltransferase [Anaeromicropila herbilytica]
MIKKIIDMVYPRRCPICGGIITPKSEKVCPLCKEQLNYIKEPRCKKCSKPLINEVQEYCYDCENKRFHFVRGYALWVYDNHMRKSIASFKYHNKREYADFYIEELLKGYSEEILKIAPDALIPVPVHKSRQNLRGYNQAEIIAKGIGKKLSIPILDKTLIRVKKTLPQKGLNDKERLDNLSHAFRFLDQEQMDKNLELDKVILVDDIYTTGSTIEACTNILLENNVKEVYFICICIGKGF